MCRGKGEGGRRCPGCNGQTALVKHNERRRANRAIRRNVVEWARREGYVPEELEQLAAAPPNVAKGWIEGKGFNPDDFAEKVPEGRPHDPEGQAAPPPVPQPGPPSPQGPVQRGRRAGPAGQAGPAAPSPAGGGGAGGRLGGGGRGASDAAGAAGSNGPRWAQNSWCTAELRGQIQTAMNTQGAHRDERALLTGTPEKVTTLSSRGSRNDGPRGGANTTRRVELGNGAVGYFKPFGGEDKRLESGFGQDSAQQSLHEAAAWRLASQLGPPWSEIVPPVVIREVNGEVGSFALERPGKTMVNSPWSTAEWREAAMFDCLIGQQDRHPGNYLVAGDRLSLIDHGYSFARPGDYRNYSWFAEQRVQNDPSLTYNERDALQRLVSSPNLLGLQDMLQPARSQALRDRAQKMLDRGKVCSDY
jgi:hypothetical protein